MKAKRSKTPAKSASKKVVIKDLKAKDDGLVKGGKGKISTAWDIETNEKF